MIVRIYDGFNYYRLIVETDQTSLAPRRLYRDMVQTPGVLHIWVWDGAGARKTRQAIYPPYKTKRHPPAEDVYSSILLFRDLLKHTTAYQIEVPGFEADDVIATLVDHYSPTATSVEIYSNDFDLMALCTKPNVVCGAAPKGDLRPEDIRVYKAFVGDPSDNVAGVPRFGKTAWAASDRKVLRAIAERCLEQKPIDDLLPLMFRGEVRGAGSLKTWVQNNPAELAAMYRVVGFLPVPTPVVAQHTFRPIHDPQRVETKLKEFLL